MPRAVILNTATKASTTGGTFADALAANSGDSMAVASFQSGRARVFRMWGIDSDSVAELEVIYTRPRSTPDQVHGYRVNIPALVPGGAANVAAHDLLQGGMEIEVFSSDTATMNVTSTAGDDVVVSWLTDYDDLAGVSSSFATWAQVQSLWASTVSFQCNAVASATPGLYGTARAFNADDTRWIANTYYAVLGVSVQTQATTIALQGVAWGSQKIGLPCGVLGLDTHTWFADLSTQLGTALIPVVNGSDAANSFVYVADGEASTSPKIDLHCYQLSSKP